MSNVIAFQGFSGAYSDLACRNVYPNWDTLPCETFDDAFFAVRDGKATLAMIPVDNTLAGRVADVHHLMPESGLHIIGEHFQPIQHSLLAIKSASIEDLKYVHSHIHALPQCKKRIKELGLKPQVHADTAGAAQEIQKQKNPEHAAIASSLAAEIYDLNILESDIQDADHNTTRFLILSKDADALPKEDAKKYITSFIFNVRNIPAALYKALGGFATNNVNMVKLESYVDKNFQAAQFYVDIVGHTDDKSVTLALEELNFYAENVTMLGTYSAHDFRNLS